MNYLDQLDDRKVTKDAYQVRLIEKGRIVAVNEDGTVRFTLPAFGLSGFGPVVPNVSCVVGDTCLVAFPGGDVSDPWVIAVRRG